MITATQCRCARTLLRWSVSKLSSAASVSQSAIHDFELERRQPSTTTTDAIRRAFEGVAAWCFSPKTTFNCGATCCPCGDRKRARDQRIFEAERAMCDALTARRAAEAD